MSRDEISRLMSRAVDSLQDARLLFDAERYGGVPNRSYYAVFDAVNALLRLHEQYAKTHKGAKVMFNELFVKTSQLPEEANVWLEQCAKLRQSGDYDFNHDVTAEEAQESIERANEFLLYTEAYLREHKFLS